MRISVCMATYNGARYIKEQLESILVQLGDDDEVVISDDGSTDETIEIIKSIDDGRVKLFFNNGERGYTNNFENALNKSLGKFIFLSDQDDIWLLGKVRKYLELFEVYDFIVSDCHVVDEVLNVIEESHFNVHQVKAGFFHNFLLPRYIGACMAFNRRVLTMALPFPGYQKYIAHDYWLSLIAELNFNVCVLKEQYLLYRRHSSNTSTGGIKSKNPLHHKIKVRLITGIMLGKRLCR